MIACALLTGVIYLAQIEIPELIEIEAENALLFRIAFYSCFLLLDIISWLSTYSRVQKYLRLHTDELY